MAEHRTRKSKANPNYQFLVSWKPSEAGVNRESSSKDLSFKSKLTASKKAEILAKEDSMRRIKKDIIKSLIVVSFVLACEVVVYLARNQVLP